MKLRDALWLSLRNILCTPLRSILTVLGMAIGIGAILAVLTLGDAGKTQVETEMVRLGIDKVWIRADKEAKLTQEDARLLARRLNTRASAQAYAEAEVTCGSSHAFAVIAGCDAEALEMTGTRLLSGRAWRPLERMAGNRRAIISATLAQSLGLGSPACQQSAIVQAGGMCFSVIGIAEREDALGVTGQDNWLLLPIAVYAELMGDGVQEIILSVPQDEQPQRLAARATRLMNWRTGAAPQTTTLQVQIEAAKSVIATFVRVLAWVAAICMLVGGIGVMNILLVSVRERRREIGMMKAMGASEGQVCLLFLLEALFFSGLGGLLGVGVGVLIISLAGRVLELNAAVRSADMATVVLAAAILGLGFGVAPAARAARLAPVDALRN